jgi:hypothetical protein
MNIISYCDDLNSLFSIHVHGQIMLDKCNEFAENWKVRFNPKKSNVVIFGTPLSK